MPAFGQVLDFRISADNRYVVYIADQDIDNIPELYSVPMGGGTPLRLTPKPSIAVYLYQITPDGSHVVYRAKQDQADVNELYSVPIAGPASATVKLNEPLVAAGEVLGFEISPDSQRVVYSADQAIDNVDELYSVPLSGPASAAIKLNGALVAGGNVGDLPKISSDSRYVVYYADQDTDNVYELYSAPIGGPAGAAIKLNGALVAGGNVVPLGFQISPNGRRVVYTADQDTDNVYELYSVSIDGQSNTRVKLNSPLVSGQFVLAFFQISPDSSRVVFQATQQQGGVPILYDVPIDGPASAAVSLQANVGYYQISSDSRRLVYIARMQPMDPLEQYSMPLVGPASAAIKLSGPLVAGGNVLNFRISPDSTRVIYTSDQQTNDIPELYSVPIDGPPGAGAKLNAPLTADGSVFEFQITPDDRRVVYSTYASAARVYQLYSVPAGGPASASARLDDPPTAGGSAYDFQISSDSRHVLYRADQDTQGVIELYEVELGYAAYLPLLTQASGFLNR